MRLAWLREMSDLSSSVARDAARLCILDQEINRLAIVGPLHETILALDDGPLVGRLNRFSGVNVCSYFNKRGKTRHHRR